MALIKPFTKMANKFFQCVKYLALRGKSRSFDEAAYLATNPDVLRAVETGLFYNGQHHWLLYGRTENRSWNITGITTDKIDCNSSNNAISLHHKNNNIVTIYRSLLGKIIEKKTKVYGLLNNSSTQYFDEAGYLLANPDVCVAVGGGAFYSGLHHWLKHGQLEGRSGSGISPYVNRKRLRKKLEGEKPVVHFYGPVSATSGLGTAARSYIEALSTINIELKVIDSTAILYPGRPYPAVVPPKQKPDVVIIHHNPDCLNHFFNTVGLSVIDFTYVIGIWVWELPAIPSSWIDHFGAFDELWSPSQFSADSIATIAHGNFPIRVVPHAVSSRQVNPIYDRQYFGLPENIFLFLVVFDPTSGLERKNPFIVAEAFSKCFHGDPGVALVFKTLSHSSNLAKLKEMCRGLNVFFIGTTLTDAEMDGLRTQCDAFVSAHRSEGFGLNIAEAMLHGKLVIATDYSGNIDFFDKDAGFPIASTLTEVTSEGAPYPVGAVWAEPDLESLQTQMRLVRSGGAEIAKIARNGIQKIGSQLSVSKIANLMLDAISAATSGSHWSDERSINAPPQAWRAPRPSSLTNLELWQLDRTVLFSLIVPTYNISRQLLEECVNSVLMQTYPHWELCLCDDASTNQETITYLRELRGIDSRIKIRFLKENRGISGCSNAALEMASGEYVVFLDNDDTISHDALAHYAEAIAKDPGIDCLYSDEDKISPNGTYVDHYFKPDWSPEHLESGMYVLHLFSVRKSLLFDIGSLRPEFTGAQDYDLALRLSRTDAKFHHVPVVLYHWRMIEGSAAAVVDAKPEALNNARRALEDYTKEKYGDDAYVSPGIVPGYFRVRHGRLFTPPVTLVITTNNASKLIEGRGKINLVTNFVKSIISKTSYRNYRIHVVSNGKIDDDLHEILKIRGDREIIYNFSGNFNFAQKANFSINTSETEHVVLLNDDMEVIASDWLDALMDHIRNDEVGAVGARLLYPNSKIQHVGMVIGVNETTAHMYHNNDSETFGYNGYAKIVRNYSAVTGACMATRKSLFNRVGGFDEAFATDYNDTDYCLKLRVNGYRIVYTPFAELYHFEGQTAIRTEQNPAERALFIQRWQQAISNDPYYNPNLARDRIDFCHNPQLWPRRH